MSNLIEYEDTSAAEGMSSSPHTELVTKLLELKQRDSRELTKDEALSLGIEAIQLSLKLVQLAKSEDEKHHYQENSSRLLTKAEDIKSASQWNPATAGSLLDFQPLQPTKAPEKSSTVSVSPSPKSPNTQFPPSKPSIGTKAPEKPSTSSVSPLPKYPNTQPRPSKPSIGTITPPESTTRSSSAATNTSVKKSAINIAAPEFVPQKTSQVQKLREPVPCREIPTSEKLLLFQGAKLHGGPYPPWDNGERRDVNHHSFIDGPVNLHTIDQNLSKTQLAMLREWGKPENAFPPPHLRIQGHPVVRPTMRPDTTMDLVQDAASDCSVVASMCAGVSRVERGFPSLLSKLFSPYDEEHDIPLMSPNGKYLLRLNFNGCFRKVWIDDLLPVSNNSRLLHILDLNNPCLLWPALLEKAYLQVRGGYNFPGSNSGTDLWVLTGWLPEHILINHEDTDPDRTWVRMLNGFKYGDVLITIGTSKLSTKTEKELGLVGEHDYAILDLKESQDGEKRVLIKNPWVNGSVWKGRYGGENDPANSSESDEGESAKALSRRTAVIKGEDENVPFRSSFWMPFRDALQNFESLYLNWNPGLFKYRTDIHFQWELNEKRSPMVCLRQNPQFSLCSEGQGQVWVILSRHFTNQSESIHEPKTEPYYISLYAFNSKGERVITGRRAIKSSPFVDAPQSLLKLDLNANERIALVPEEQNLPESTYTFTISAFGQNRLSINPARPRYANSVSIDGAWTEETAGGNSSPKGNYLKNPQYALHLPASSPVCITLETPKKDDQASIHVKLLHGRGRRVEKELLKRDVLLDSDRYRPGCVAASTNQAYVENNHDEAQASAEEPAIPRGDYTIIVSAFHAGYLGKYTLTVHSNTNARISMIPRSGAGRLRRRFADVSFNTGVRKVAAPFAVHRLVTVYFKIKSLDPKNSTSNSALPPPSPSPVRLSIENGKGPERVIVVASGEGAFMDASTSSGVRTADVQMDSAKNLCQNGTKGASAAVRAGATRSQGSEMWMVVERMGTELNRGEERFSVEGWADVPDWGQIGVWRDSDD